MDVRVGGRSAASPACVRWPGWSSPNRPAPFLCRLPGGYRLVVPARTWRTLDSAYALLVLRHELRISSAATFGNRSRCACWPCRIGSILSSGESCGNSTNRGMGLRSASRRSDPENVANYAPALLHLSHRAEPLFFATRAAQGRGLYQRIRLLLSPAKKTDSVMKKTVLATLLVVLSLVNATRLESRAAVPTLAADTPAEEKPKRPAATPLAAPARAAKLGIKDGVLYVDLYDNELTIPLRPRQRGSISPIF